MFNSLKKLFKKEKVEPLPIPVSEVLEIEPKKKVKLYVENEVQAKFFGETPIVNHYKTFFKEPKTELKPIFIEYTDKDLEEMTIDQLKKLALQAAISEEKFNEIVERVKNKRQLEENLFEALTRDSVIYKGTNQASFLTNPTPPAGNAGKIAWQVYRDESGRISDLEDQLGISLTDAELNQLNNTFLAARYILDREANQVPPAAPVQPANQNNRRRGRRPGQGNNNQGNQQNNQGNNNDEGNDNGTGEFLELVISLAILGKLKNQNNINNFVKTSLRNLSPNNVKYTEQFTNNNGYNVKVLINPSKLSSWGKINNLVGNGATDQSLNNTDLWKDISASTIINLIADNVSDLDIVKMYNEISSQPNDNNVVFYFIGGDTSKAGSYKSDIILIARTEDGRKNYDLENDKDRLEIVDLLGIDDISGVGTSVKADNSFFHEPMIIAGSDNSVDLDVDMENFLEDAPELVDSFKITLQKIKDLENAVVRRGDQTVSMGGATFKRDGDEFPQNIKKKRGRGNQTYVTADKNTDLIRRVKILTANKIIEDVENWIKNNESSKDAILDWFSEKNFGKGSEVVSVNKGTYKRGNKEMLDIIKNNPEVKLKLKTEDKGGFEITGGHYNPDTGKKNQSKTNPKMKPYITRPFQKQLYIDLEYNGKDYELFHWVAEFTGGDKSMKMKMRVEPAGRENWINLVRDIQANQTNESSHRNFFGSY